MLDYIKDTYKDSDMSDKEYLNLYSSVDLLIIDDLGKEKTTEWVLEKLFLIINNRYNNYLPIVITTNYNINQLTHLANSERIYIINLDGIKNELLNIWKSIDNLWYIK